MTEQDRTDRLFHALSDATRRDIVTRTLRREHSVSDLAGGYPMSFAAVQKHVAVLERAGLVHKRRQGREQLVRGDIAAVQRTHELLGAFERPGVSASTGSPRCWRTTWHAEPDPAVDTGRTATADGTDVTRRADPPSHRPARRTGASHDRTPSPQDSDTLTMTFTAEFDAPVERVWNLWEDPRLLERWWGPPTWPATFTDHDVRPGGRSRLRHVRPGRGDVPRLLADGGRRAAAAVRIRERVRRRDGGAGPDMPLMVVRVDLGDRPGGGTEMTGVVAFTSAADMERILAMGMEEGMTAAMGQMDDLL